MSDKSNTQKRHWMITMHFDKEYETFDDVLYFMKEEITKVPNVRYSIFQIEVCPTTNNLHLQIYLELTKSVRRSKVIKMMTFTGFKHPHCEARIHSRDACRKYCKKNESRLEGTNYVEIGIWRQTESSSQKSTGFASIAELIQQGRDSMWIAYNRPELYLRYGDRIDKCISLRKAYEKVQLNQVRKQLLSEAKDYQEEE